MSLGVDLIRLQRVFDKPELVRLLDRLQARFERGINSPVLILAKPDLAERKAIASLLGRSVGSGRSIRIVIADLEGVIQKADLAPNLRSAVAQLRGPLRDLNDEKKTQAQAWQAVFESIEIDAAFKPWLEKLRQDGLLKRLSQGDTNSASTLLQQALSVIRQLPGQGQTLSTLAAKTLGDAHALDTGRPVATLIKRFLGQERFNKDEEESEREIWARAGVLVGGGITSTVLALNLPVVDEDQHGEPQWLTLRQLVRNPPPWQVNGCRVYVCENPAVVAEAADFLSADCAPLVCTYGQPRAAVNHLLDQLQQAGAELFYHGDFDWPGISIANGIMSRFNAQPWHFDEAGYRQAAATGTMALKGRIVQAEWDAGLSQAMIEKNIAIPEERVLGLLLKSLQK